VLETAQRDAVHDADLLIATTADIADALPPSHGRRAHVLANGVDYDRFIAAANSPCPAEIADIPRPRIGHCGVINRKLDYGLVEEIALRRTDWHWVFIGPEWGLSPTGDADTIASYHAWQRCRRLPNVHHIGLQPPEKFIPCLHHMDVNVICNRTDGGWWQAAYPLKFHEYLATGRPIVATPIRSLQEFTGVSAFVTGVDSWIDALEHAIENGGVGTSEARRAVARRNDWGVRVDEFESLLGEVGTVGGDAARDTI
jgi:glycosyltransferase involved in cell wall biosynthesis